MKNSALAMLIILLFSATALRQSDLPTAEEILDNLDSANDALKSFVCDYYQEVIDEFGDKSITRGQAFFLSPGRYLLTSIFDGKVLEEVGKNEKYAWRIRHHLKKVDKVVVSESEKLSQGFSLSDAGDMKEKFDFTLAGLTEDLATGPAYHLIGISREKSTVNKLEIWVDVEKPSPIVKFLAYKRDITESFTFSNIRRDVAIDKSKFEYRVPRGYQEVEL